MLRISKDTKLGPAEVIALASRFFGESGEGLVQKEGTPCGISFEGAGGFVQISVSDEGKHRTVDVKTREFEYQAKQFLKRV